MFDHDPYRSLPPTPAQDPTVAEGIVAARQELLHLMSAGPSHVIAIPPTGYSGCEFPYLPEMYLRTYFGFDGSSGQPGSFRPVGLVTSAGSYLLVDSRYYDEIREYSGDANFTPLLFTSLSSLEPLSEATHQILLDNRLFYEFDRRVLIRLMPKASFIDQPFESDPHRRSSPYTITVSSVQGSVSRRDLTMFDSDKLYVFTNPEHARLLWGLVGEESPLTPLTKVEFAIADGCLHLVGDIQKDEADLLSLAPVAIHPNWAHLFAFLPRRPVFVDRDSLRLSVSALIEGWNILQMPDELLASIYIRDKLSIANAEPTLNEFCHVISEFLDAAKNTSLLHGLTEHEIAEVIHARLSSHPKFLGRSFPWVIALNDHAALPHYKPRPAERRVARPGDIFLMDIGCQYEDITTDITRTIFLPSDSAPPRQLVMEYTLLLKAHIALSSARFFKSTSGAALDLLTRQELLKHGRNFGHGTGHGVGLFANVHEGPFRISPRSNSPIPEGVLITNEPGLYTVGSHGIRIENIMTAKPVAGQPDVYCFQTLTYIPYDPDLIDFALLTQDETAWLLHYESRCPMSGFSQELSDSRLVKLLN